MSAFDALACVIAASVISAGLPDVAFAYVDPSVMTYTIQAVAGAAVALSAVFGVAFRRTRKWLFDRLGIDADAKRESDPAWAKLAEPGQLAIGMGVEQLGGGARDRDYSEAKERERETRGFSWSARFGLAFIVSFMTAGTLLFAAPIDVVSGSSDFVFSASHIAPLLLVETIMVSLLAALALSALKGRAFAYALAIVFAVGVGFYLQALFMNRNLPLADGTSLDWGKRWRVMVVSSVVWLALAVASVALVKLVKGRAPVIVATLSVFLVLVQGVGSVFLILGESSATLPDGSPAASKAVVTEEGLFDVGSADNVIVFVLDTYDTSDFEAALKQEPSLADALTGFTWYDNVCGAMIPTRYGLPFLLTGERPHTDDAWSTFLKERYNRSPFLQDLSDAGYSTGLYTDNLKFTTTTPEIAQTKVIDLAFNLSDTPVAMMDMAGTLESMAIVALYRDAPWVLKPLFWFDTDEVVEKTLADAGGDFAKNQYKRDDAEYYERLQKLGLTIEDRGTKGTFRFIHMTGTHLPHVMNANGEIVGKADASRVSQAIGTMRIAEQYLAELKRLGVYDDATIIFTADHGKWYLTDKFLKEPSSPYIVFKPSQNHEEASKPLATSHAPVMHDDVVATVIDAIGGDAGKYEGRPLTSYTGQEDQSATRLYLSTQSDRKNDTNIVEYAIEGDVMDLNNWRLTGRSWDAQQ